VIRRAIPGDAEAIEALNRRAWMRAYGEFLDVASALDEPGPRVARWRERVLSEVVTTLVWDQGGRVAGFVAAGASDDPGTPLDHGSIRALYVDPPAQGAGVGSALLDAALEHLRERGFRGVDLWTFAENHHARAFYERRGFAAVEGSDATDPGTGAPELRYRRAL
jgi:ribosomal protein S18 acetylase RimI-like enzyme